jgi:hypothetical protein
MAKVSSPFAMRKGGTSDRRTVGSEIVIAPLMSIVQRSNEDCGLALAQAYFPCMAIKVASASERLDVNQDHEKIAAIG